MPDLTGYKLTFDDEFNSLSVSQSGVGTTWADIRTPSRLTSTSDGGFGDSDAAFVDPASGIDPFPVRDGAVTIQATPTSSPVVGTKRWASGLLDTQASFSQTYGYFEMRAAFPQQAGAWPAFWMLREDNTPVVELDTAEAYGDPALYSTVHSNQIPGGFQSDVSNQPSQASGFHTYGVLWNAKTISFYYDGKPTSTQQTPSDMNKAMYLIADLSIKDVPGLTQAPKDMTIDYVRAYSDNSAARSVVLQTISSPDGLTSADLEGATSGSSVVCYASGTMIRTADGDIAVERLRIGDLVVTASGGRRPIRWIGHRAYAARFANTNPDLLPVRIEAGAIAAGVPARDLLVSPRHALLLDGVLIPAAALVNGASVVKVTRVDNLDYWHVELDSHDVLLAENTPAESFVDDEGRGLFHNARSFHELYPDAIDVDASYCAPRVESGPLVAAVRRRLAERAGLAGAQVAPFGELRGRIETCDGGVVTGWAQDALHPDAPICLDVLVDGERVALTYADRYRHDLTADGIGDGRHGFRLALPPTAVRPHVVELRRSADGAALAGGPWVVDEGRLSPRAA